MPDITMCTGKLETGLLCPKADTCYRYLVKPDTCYQSYFTETPWNKEGKYCVYYWAESE